MDWQAQYRANLQKTAIASSQNKELIEHCDRLSDHVLALKAEKTLLETELSKLRASSASDPRATSSKAAAPDSTDPVATDDVMVARLRLDLAEALRAKGAFEVRAKAAEEELARLRTRTAADSKTIDTLSAECRALGRKLRDREEELGAKKKLVADVQDELSVLHLQLNVVEQKHAEKVRENKQLVTRYMQRVGKEAEEMNKANEPFFKTSK